MIDGRIVNTEELLKKAEKITKSVLVFQFICPKCGNIHYDGVVDFDMEDYWTCEKCSWANEAWCFPHTIKGTNLWTVGGHYNNDPMTHLTEEEVMDQFTNVPIHHFCHGAEPYALGTLKEVLQ